MSKYKLVTFDAYSALADLRSTLGPIIQDNLKLNKQETRSFLATWRTKQLDAAAISNALDRGRTTFHDCTALALDYSAAHHNMVLPKGLRAEFIHAWYQLRWWPEASEVLKTLQRRGYILAILSNGDQTMLESLVQPEHELFDHIFSSEKIGAYKPAPAIYDLPLIALGIERHEYIHVAGGANDVVGAKSSGIFCYWSNRSSDQVLYPDLAADYQGPDLKGLLKIL